MDWFAKNGDRLFTFITLASAALQGVDHLPGWLSQAILVCGILATAAHQSFFSPVNPAQGPASTSTSLSPEPGILPSPFLSQPTE